MEHLDPTLVDILQVEEVDPLELTLEIIGLLVHSLLVVPVVEVTVMVLQDQLQQEALTLVVEEVGAQMVAVVSSLLDTHHKSVNINN